MCLKYKLENKLSRELKSVLDGRLDLDLSLLFAVGGCFAVGLAPCV